MSILGVWMWPQSVRMHGAKKVVSICARAGVTDILFLAKGMAGTTAFAGSFAPRACGRDLLQELLDEAHCRGIRVHAWMTSTSDEHYKQLHPESSRCHFTRGRDKGLISLADEGYLAYMENITRELCRRYAVDGLHLDYIRYNHLLYGWGEDDIARYAAEGADPARLRGMMERTFICEEGRNEACIFDALRAGDESAMALARARRKDVVRFARRLTAAARAENSRLTLSAALMPEGAYEDTAFSDLHYGQNYADAAALYDAALPMAYSIAYGKDSGWMKTVAEGTLKHGLATVMGLHAYEGGTGATLKADIAALCGVPIDGLCLFREGAFAFAFAEGKSLSVYNATEADITRITAECGGETVSFPVSIRPGDEARFPLPCVPNLVRAYTGDKEICVHLTKNP